jgi:Na+-transporting NADH:ubiquinone oxidoreductase subunit E
VIVALTITVPVNNLILHNVLDEGALAWTGIAALQKPWTCASSA